MVYVDLLVVEDLIINYLILIGTGILLNRIIKFKNIFLSSVIGTISLIFLFIDINKLLIFIISFIFSIIMSIISFKYKDIIYTIKNIMYMYFISIFLAGTIYLINTNFMPHINSYILNTIILIIIAIFTTYIYVKSLKKIKIINSNYYQIDIYLKDKPKITITSFLDTGNKLTDPYTHKPIILISNKTVDINKEKIILVPYNTIDSHGLLKCFLPEKIYIHKIGYRKNILIGIIDEVGIEGADCILNQKIF